MNQDTFGVQLEKILEEADPKEAFYKLCDLYVSADGEQREDIRRQWPFDRPWKLPDQSRLACVDDGDRSCGERIRVSLIYDSIEDFRVDWRDNLVGICRVYHSAILAGIDPDKLFREVAALSSERGARMIINFIERDEKDKSLQAFRYIESPTPDGVSIVSVKWT